MKLKTKIIALLALASSALVIPANAAVTFSNGDLILAIRGGTEAKTLFVNLGLATGYRDATTGNANVVTILSDLDANFTGWKTRSDVTWGLFGVRATNTLTAGVNGDPGQTIYVSRAQTTLGTQATAWGSTGQTVGQTAHTNAATNMNTVQGVFDVATGTDNLPSQAAVLADAASGSYGTNGSTWAAFTNGGGTRGNFGAGTAGTALDLFRSLGTTTGASPSGTLRVGSYEGTFFINDFGVVSYATSPAAIPEPSRALLLGLSATGLLFRRRRSAVKA
jgi:hypothetical protein